MDQLAFVGDAPAAVSRARTQGRQYVLDDLYIPFAVSPEGALTRYPTNLTHTPDPRRPLGHVAFHVRLTDSATPKRLDSGFHYIGFAIHFDAPDHSFAETIFDRLMQSSTMRDVGNVDGARPWALRIWDGAYFEVKEMSTSQRSDPQFQRIDADGFDPDWIVPTAGSTMPEDVFAPPPRPLSGWWHMDHDARTGRDIFRKLDAGAYHFEVRAADGTVLLRTEVADRGEPYREAWMSFEDNSEGHRVRLLEMDLSETVLDLPRPEPAPRVDYAGHNLSTVAIPASFDGDGLAALNRAAAHGHALILDNQLRIFRVVDAGGRLHVLRPDAEAPAEEDFVQKSYTLHAMTTDTSANGMCLEFPATADPTDRIRLIERWINILGPGRALRDAEGLLFDGARFEVRRFDSLQANPWRHPIIDATAFDPARLTIS